MKLNKATFYARMWLVIFALGLTCLSSMAARADDDDPPGRALNIRYISGQVSVQPGGVDDWVGAVVNRPLTTSDRVWTDQGSRTELTLGSGVLRMDAETSVTLTNVDDTTVQVELDQGALLLRVRRLNSGEFYEVDTPNLAFTVQRPGVYRFDVDPNADTTRVSVFSGEGDATGQGSAVSVRAGDVASFTSGTSLQNQMDRISGGDGFDDWGRVRDEREEHSRSAQYVSPDVVGADELDEYGSWSNTPEYGAVWVPTQVRQDWAPYRDGHWAWVDPWGWTWVDDQPWGFAPSHYGRWVHYQDRWGWAPGPVTVRPVYAPALVAFVGGAGFGVSVGFGGGGGVGWFPIGYGEPYVPPYRASRNYFQNVNVSNTRITNINNVTNNYYNNTTNVTKIVYVNKTVPGATTAVSRDVMVNSRPVGRAAVRVPEAELRQASLQTAAPIAPTRSSVLGLKAGAPRAAPASAVQRQVITKAAPPPRVIPFEAKQQALAKDPGRPLDRSTAQQIRATLPPPVQRPAARPVQAGGNPQPGAKPAPGPGGAPNGQNAPKADNAPRQGNGPPPPANAGGNQANTNGANNGNPSGNVPPRRTGPPPPNNVGAAGAPGGNATGNQNPNGGRVIPRPPDRNNPNQPGQPAPGAPNAGRPNQPQNQAPPNPGQQGDRGQFNQGRPQENAPNRSNPNPAPANQPNDQGGRNVPRPPNNQPAYRPPPVNPQNGAGAEQPRNEPPRNQPPANPNNDRPTNTPPRNMQPNDNGGRPPVNQNMDRNNERPNYNPPPRQNPEPRSTPPTPPAADRNVPERTMPERNPPPSAAPRAPEQQRPNNPPPPQRQQEQRQPPPPQPREQKAPPPREEKPAPKDEKPKNQSLRQGPEQHESGKAKSEREARA